MKFQLLGPAKYRASRNSQGHLVIHNVPIFIECERGDVKFDADWISSAVLAAKTAEVDGYMPPLHIRHHGEDAPAAPAGFFRVTGAGEISFKGEAVTAIFADLVVTQPHVEDDVLAMRLPYRSVEIFNVEKPVINSLALLDHEPPFLELPMLMVEQPADAGQIPTSGQTVRMSVAHATFANPWQSKHYSKANPVVACFTHGATNFFLTQDTDGMKITTKDGETKGGKKFADDSKNPFASGDDTPADGDVENVDDDPNNPEDGGEAMEASTSDSVKAICETIKSGAISVADLEALKQAIIEVLGGNDDEDTEEEPTEEQAAAPAPTPGEAMKNQQKTDDAAAKAKADEKTNDKPAAVQAKATPELAEQFAALAGENKALKARLDERDAHDTRRDDVADALKRLDGRPLGANLEDELVAFHKDHGAGAFKVHVDKIEATFAAVGGRGNDSKAASFSADPNTPKEVLAYTDKGTDAVEKAGKFAREYDELAQHRSTHMSRERYIAINMGKLGIEKPEAKAS